MGCCKNDSPPPRIPRKNGFSWPPHTNQIIYWIVLIAYQIIYNGVLVPSLQKQWQIPAYLFLNMAFLFHVVTHIRVLTINPANDDLIRNWPAIQPELDKSLHRHVIEDSHCNICQITVPDGGKHCGKCNKCVADFDHHCTWLNTCIGGRNYMAFLACVSTTVIWCTTIFGVSVVLAVMYFVNKSWLSLSKDFFAFNSSSDAIINSNNVNPSFEGGVHFANLSSWSQNDTGRLFLDRSLVVFVPVKDEVWLAVVMVSAAISGYIDGLVIYLLGFHVYLICTGQSTYHVTRKDQLTVRPKLDGPLKRSLHRSCLSKLRGKMRCRVAQIKQGCTGSKEDGTARLDVEAASIADTDDGVNAAAAGRNLDANKNAKLVETSPTVEGITSKVLYNDEDGVLPSQTQFA